MPLTVPKAFVETTSYEPLSQKHPRYGGRKVVLDDAEMTTEMLGAVLEEAKKHGERTLARVVESMMLARSGDFSKTVPQWRAAPDMILSYLRHHLRDGWLYRKGSDGHLYPWLVTAIKMVPARRQDDQDHITIALASATMIGGRRGGGDGPVLSTTSITLYPADVTKKKVSDILDRTGYLVETKGLRDDYDAGLENHLKVMADGFSEQFIYSGQPTASKAWDSTPSRSRVKVIHDLHPDEMQTPAESAPSVLFGGNVADDDDEYDGDYDDLGIGQVPLHFTCPVFDLSTHEFITVNTRDLVRYEYDKTLREKIVLPEDQRNLLDILTSNLNEFTGDVVAGKTTGNVVLCKGEPGVGKTLTAEIYSELIERPLYSIHSGSLGVEADDVRKNLETIFQRAKRWAAVLLLDEADVFVLERGDNLTQNAIVAEFLRTMEYFDGLMFMTTNRAKDIDDAILSRAAAIIDYKIPDMEGIAEVWRVQGRQHGITIDEDLLADLVEGFAHITPRDVKMLLRLSLRVAKGRGVPLSTEVVADAAMFRGLHFEKGSRLAAEEASAES